MSLLARNNSHRNLSKFATRTLRRLATGGSARKVSGGSYRIGSSTFPENLMHELSTRDLIEVNQGHVFINSRGEALLRRLDATKRRGKTVGERTDPFMAQHQERKKIQVKTSDGLKKSVTMNLSESPLWWLKSRKDKEGRPLISQAQFEAGERLRTDWELAHKGPRVTMNWDGRVSQGPNNAPFDPTPAQLRAKLRVEDALSALGPGLKDIALRICCHHEGLEVAERAMSWPQRSGKVVLAIALDQLAEHYNLGE